MTGLWVAIASGVLLAAGLWALAGYFVPAHPRLGDALKVMDGRAAAPEPSASGAQTLCAVAWNDGA